MKISHKRILIQLGFFILFNTAFLGIPLLPLPLPVLECFSIPNKTVLCNFGVLQRNLSFTWELYPVFPLASIAMFLIIGAFVGRAMCGWACPLGFFQDLWAHVPRFFERRQKELPQKLHYLLTSVKYMVLFGTLAIVVSIGATYIFSRLLGRRYAFSLGVCGQAPYCLICPVPILFVTIPSLLNTLFMGAPLPQLPLTFYIGFAAFMTLLVASLAVKRFWCRYVCPLGGLMSLFNKFSILHIKKKRGECTTFCRGHQRNCSETCPMGIEVSRDEEPSSNPECILCYNCAESCTNKAIKYKIG
jgi:polyferredoxin